MTITSKNPQEQEQQEEVTLTQKFKQPQWYSDARKYWESVPSTVDGMLGGLGELDPLDIAYSNSFLTELFDTHGKPSTEMRACDMGAGIGRITKNLLINQFEVVDMVESNAEFLKNARQFVGDCGRLDRLINSGLEQVEVEKGRYHVIWCQWVLSHLTDDHLVEFLQKCLLAVQDNGGYVILKENVSRSDDYVIDNEDSSVTRSLQMWKSVFDRLGSDVQVVMERIQPNFPQYLFPVYMWALRIK